MAMIEEMRGILDETLQLAGRSQAFDQSTPLLGSLPELDSVAVVTLLTVIEERFGIFIEDDEISAETFATLGALCDFVDAKIAA
ncbi:MAG: acyl carrier protein [Sphingomonadales bacterium]